MTSAPERQSADGKAPARLFRHRFLVLLASLILMLMIAPFLEPLEQHAFHGLSKIAVSALFSLILLAGVYAVSDRGSTVRIALLLAVPVIALQAINVELRSEGLGALIQALGIVFLGLTCVVLVRFLFSSQQVSGDMLAASLCVYLLLGIAWSFGFSLIEWLQPGSFAYGLSAEGIGVVRFGAEQSGAALYYSFVTLATLGYGDITPASTAAGMFAALEAVVGQLYLAVLVARLVGLHISHVAAPRRAAW